MQVNVGGVQNMLGGCTNEVGGCAPPRKSASDHLPYSKLPTKLVVLQRLFFEIESGYPLSPALSTVQQELKALWAYAGYEDILMSNSNLVVEIRKLHKSYKDLLKFNVAKRELPRFKKKEELFLDQLPVLFNITVNSLIPSNLITAEDRGLSSSTTGTRPSALP